MIDIYNISKTSQGTVTEPVTLDEAKQYMNVDFNDFDALITSLITQERQTVEHYCQLALVPSLVEFTVETTGMEKVMIPYVANGSLTVNYNKLREIKCYNPITPLARRSARDGDYFTDGNVLLFNVGGIYNVSVDANNSVPDDLKQCILMLVAYRFNHRGDEQEGPGIPPDIVSKLKPHVVTWL